MNTTQENPTSAAIAEQEEHIKRSTSCKGQVGKAHAFRAAGRPGESGGWSACVVCGVTETAADYARRLASA